MSPGDGSLPNHIHIELPNAQELDRWCDCNHGDGRRSCVTSIAVDGTFLYSLLDNDSRFQALVVLEIRGEVPPAPQSSCKSLLPSPWPGLQELTGENDALRHIYDRYRLRIPKLVVRLPLNVSVSDAPTTFRRNVAAFQPDTLTVQLYCTEWFEWHAFEEFLVRLSNTLKLY